MEPLGTKIRKQRRRLGLSQDELAGRSAISKPYLSLIETGRSPNPPSDEIVQRIEQTLGFGSGELLAQAHLLRTPLDVRAALGRLLANGPGEMLASVQLTVPKPGDEKKQSVTNTANSDLSEIMRELVDNAATALESVNGNAVPIINRIATDYPKDFDDLSYPPRIADQYIGCPDVSDAQAFAARVHGDSMTPKYNEGNIVVFSPALAVRVGDDCFVRFNDGQTTFKRIFFETDADGRSPVVRLQPRNERHRAIIVPRELVAGMYRAVYRYQRVDED